MITSDGTVIDQSEVASAGIYAVDSLDSSASESLATETPEAGGWQLQVDDPSLLGAVSFSAYSRPPSPTLAFSTPVATPGGQFTWDGSGVPPNSYYV